MTDRIRRPGWRFKPRCWRPAYAPGVAAPAQRRPTDQAHDFAQPEDADFLPLLIATTLVISRSTASR